MSRKSTNSESSKKFKKIRNDLMNFERDEIIKVKNSNKDIKITKFEDSNKKVPNSKYSLTSKNLEQVKFEGISPNIEIIIRMKKMRLIHQIFLMKMKIKSISLS